MTVQPAVQGVQQAPDGSVAAVDIQLLVDACRCNSNAGGGCTLTFPWIAAGDECIRVSIRGARALIMVAIRPGTRHRRKRACTIWPTALPSLDCFRSDDHDRQRQHRRRRSCAATTAIHVALQLNPATQKIKIVAPGGLE